MPPIKPLWWHRFFHPVHKHCFALRYEREGVWTLVEPWWTRIMIRTVDNAKARKFLQWAQRGNLLLVTEYLPGTSSQVRGWMTCAALICHMLGRPYQLWTPHQLFRRLIAEDGTRHINATALIECFT